MTAYIFDCTKHVDYVVSIAKSANACGYHFGAIVYKGKNIISSGWCQCKTHPKQAKFMRYAKPYKRNNSFLHAEMHSLITARGETEGCDMIVARWASGELRSSHPCGACMAALKIAGIRYVWYWSEEKKIWTNERIV